MKTLILVLAILLFAQFADAQCYARVSDQVLVSGLENVQNLWKYGTWLVWDTANSASGTNSAQVDGRTKISEDLLFRIPADDQFTNSANCPIVNEAVKFDYEEATGTANHKGVYAVVSASTTGPPYAIAFPDTTARYIPIPVAALNGANVDLTWSAPTVEVPGDVTGYKVYSLADEVTEVYIADSATNSYTVVAPGAGSYRYCIYLKYRTIGAAVNSAYCSGNSNEVTVP